MKDQGQVEVVLNWEMVFQTRVPIRVPSCSARLEPPPPLAPSEARRFLRVDQLSWVRITPRS